MVTPPVVVYHAAAMGNWQEVVREQMLMLRECGLAAAMTEANEKLRITHVGTGLDWILDEAARQDVPAMCVKTDGNIDHYETFAMIEIERLAKEENINRPILYFHTKGVSNPGDNQKALWRHVMGHYVVHRWRENLEILKERDAVGFNWWNWGDRHFSGTF